MPATCPWQTKVNCDWIPAVKAIPWIHVSTVSIYTMSLSHIIDQPVSGYCSLAMHDAKSNVITQPASYYQLRASVLYHGWKPFDNNPRSSKNVFDATTKAHLNEMHAKVRNCTACVYVHSLIYMMLLLTRCAFMFPWWCEYGLVSLYMCNPSRCWTQLPYNILHTYTFALGKHADPSCIERYTAGNY